MDTFFFFFHFRLLLVKGRPVRGTTSHSSFFKNPIILGLLLKKKNFSFKRWPNSAGLHE